LIGNPDTCWPNGQSVRRLRLCAKDPYVISRIMRRYCIVKPARPTMTYFPEPHPSQRALRLRLNTSCPAVVRFEDGRWLSAKLVAISLTGGLLQLTKPLIPGTLIELTFMSQHGPVLGLAELLQPASPRLRCLQAFKFVLIDDSDHQKLTELIGDCSRVSAAETGTPTGISPASKRAPLG